MQIISLKERRRRRRRIRKQFILNQNTPRRDFFLNQRGNKIESEGKVELHHSTQNVCLRGLKIEDMLGLEC